MRWPWQNDEHDDRLSEAKTALADAKRAQQDAERLAPRFQAAQQRNGFLQQVEAALLARESPNAP